ncbi:MAG: beta-propeller repeat protein, partial [Capsulimonas sp.]|nr:beta-propeller repeat protein [Capsulimonas sp.]
LSPDEKTRYVTLGDMNAVAVVSLPEAKLDGYLPVGWYPTGAVVSPDGKRLFVANAKGVAARNPNDTPHADLTERPQYIQNIIEGTVTTLNLDALPPLKTMTAKVLANNQGVAGKNADFRNPGIKHVFYIVKENRTYDQVLGDLPQGNGDPALVLFGRDVTPNLHALAERFVLLDNFYCCAEVSGDGWNWSTGAMASEYTERNVPHNYGGRRRPYDFEGTNNGVAVDRIDAPDTARPPGGYIWDLCASKGVSFRNYGFFTDDLELPRKTAEEGTEGLENSPTKKALLGKSSAEFRQFDTSYADSEAWVAAKIDPAPKQMLAYGKFKDPSRVTAWKREFAQYVKNGDLPSFSMLRVMRDHTAGSADGASSARAMVADNDYAVGQIVETISRSPYWKSSAIVIVEDDAQNGYDHVDAHRSIAFVISPFIEKGTHDSRFHNTDSALRTIEVLLGLPPMTQYDAIAPPIDVFGKTALNADPYAAILPAKQILAEVNTKKAYRSQDSARLLNPLKEESAPDEQLNDILWRSIKGTTPPERRYTLTTARIKDNDD